MPLRFLGDRFLVPGVAPILVVDPQQGENILPQASITVTVLPRYTGRFAIDRHLIPDDQVENPSLYAFVFRPGTGRDITAFRPGAHTATFEAWPDNKTFEEAKAAHLISPYTWRFNVG